MSNAMPADEAILLTGASAQKGHPKGLGVLFTTEMWERFNFYGMRTILTLFLVNSLAMGEQQASFIYGGYLGLCYLTPMLGGYVADKFLGNRTCILLGGSVMCIGQLILFFSASSFQSNLSFATTLMWIALGTIIIGNGFFKPNISSMVGQLYPSSQKSKLDSAFTIFYMGINVGAFLGQFICPFVGDVKTQVTAADGTISFVRNIMAFRWGFLAAAIAMFLGVVSFYFLKDRYVVTHEGKPIGGKPAKASDVITDPDEIQAQFSKQTAFIMVGLMIVLYFLIQYLAWSPEVMPLKGSGLGAYFSALAVSPIQTYIYPFIYAAGISLAVFILTDKSLTKVETQRVLVLYIVSFFVIFFWAAFEQSGSSLTFIADNQTDTKIFGWLMPPSMVQIFNGMFIVILAIPFSLMWSALNKRNLEPISTVKQAIGLVLIGLGYLMIATQVKDIGTTGKIGVIWLILLYFFHTCGELCLSPIGLSLVAKLAPKRFASLLMGVWFLGNAAGYALTGTLGALLPPTGEKYTDASKAGIDLKAILDGTVKPTAEQLSYLAKNKIETVYPQFAGFAIHDLYQFFMVFVILCCGAGILLYALTPLLKRMMHGVR